MLATSWVRFAHEVWKIDEYSHGPIVVVVTLFLVWRQRAAFSSAQPPARAGAAYLLLGLGLALYYIGARVRTGSLEALGQIAICASAAWIFGGLTLLRNLRFPLLFLLLSVPVPGAILASTTNGLKQFVSATAAILLYSVGYPVARNGVVLTVGPYQLFVADACSGMNSIFGLTAIGLLYLHLMATVRRWAWWTVVFFLIPIAIAANVVRVVVLILLTYHFGDEVGQGFAHEFAGLLLFAVALFAVFSLVQLTEAIEGKRSNA